MSYIEPLRRAWARVEWLLFRPFDLERWLVLGFAAFLAGLTTQGWFSGNVSPRVDVDLDRWGHDPIESLAEAAFGSSWFWLGGPLILIGVLLGLLLLWLSSRGKFMFLDGLVQGRPAIVDPWNRYGRLGDSLFLFSVAFYVGAALVALLVLSPAILFGDWISDQDLSFVAVLPLTGVLLIWIACAVTAGLALLMLHAFVVPIMYARGCSTLDAWRLFLPLARRRIPELTVFVVLVFVAWAAALLGLALLAIVTCCILPLLLWIPYVSSVLLLPLSATFRLYTVEFLQAMAPEFTLIAGPDDAGTPPGGSGHEDPPAGGGGDRELSG